MLLTIRNDIEINQKNWVAYKKRGITKRKSKDFVGAVEDFTKAIECNPSNTDLLFNSHIVTYKPLGLLNNKSVLKKYLSKSCEKINSPKKTNSAEINTENSANF